MRKSRPSSKGRGGFGKLAGFWVEFERELSRGADADGFASRSARNTYLQALRLLQFKPLWWQRVCSPLAVRKLRKMQHSLGARRPIDAKAWLQIHRVVSQLRFGYSLSPADVAHLDRCIRDGLLTDRDAWRLTHSCGCRITDGQLLPSPLSRAAALASLLIALITAILSLASAQSAYQYWFAPCRNGCAFLGFFVLAGLGTYLAPLLLCLTWGRRDAALYLQKLLQLSLGAEGLAQRPIFARLTW